jgi:hypothetical protein
MALVFLFYVLNYRLLKIYITEEYLSLRFGIVGWKTPLANIKQVSQDDSPWWIKYGGAGVHFAFVNKHYRAFYNFLEFPRLLVTFHQKQGLVQALVFTSRDPDRILEILSERLEQ